MSDDRADEIAREYRHTHLLNVALAAVNATSVDGAMGKICDIAEAAIAAALRSYGDERLEAAAAGLNLQPLDFSVNESIEFVRSLKSIQEGNDMKTAAAETGAECGHCGLIHKAVCPRIKAIDYHDDGVRIRRIEYHSQEPTAAALRAYGREQADAKLEEAARCFGDGHHEWSASIVRSLKSKPEAQDTP